MIKILNFIVSILYAHIYYLWIYKLSFGINLIFLIFLVKFDPKLDKEYEYSNDLNDYDDDNEEEEKDEKIFEKLKRHWKFFYDYFILLISMLDKNI